MTYEIKTFEKPKMGWAEIAKEVARIFGVKNAHDEISPRLVTDWYNLFKKRLKSQEYMKFK